MSKRPKVFDAPEFKVFEKLNTPVKVQDFIERMPINFQTTCRSPLSVLRKNRAYCIEAAFLAAAIFWYHGRKPLVLVLQTVKHDYDHVLALFSAEGGHSSRGLSPEGSASGGKGKKLWGAISKTNHPVLRYREPVYKNVRELAMSFFHEYFMDDGKKTMRGYSEPLDLRKFGTDWVISKKDIWHLDDVLAKAKYHKILDREMLRRLRRADKIEIRATKATQWKRK